MEGRWYLIGLPGFFSIKDLNLKISAHIHQLKTIVERFNLEDHSGGIIAALCFILFYLYIPTNKSNMKKPGHCRILCHQQ